MLQSILSDTRNRVFIAEHGGEPAGYAYAELRHEPEAALRRARTRCTCTTSACGPSFVVMASAWRWSRPCAMKPKRQAPISLTLAVWHFNEAARAFFEREGFSVFHERMESRA